MPVYEYQCTECSRIEEAFQKISDEPLTKCPHCQGKLKKLISHSSFHLKGSGWYVTDYGGAKSGTETKTDSAAKPASTEKKTASKKTSEKSD